MSPVRILVLMALGYILYRLLFSQKGAETTGSAPLGDHRREEADGLLVEDPVCHTYIPQQGAESLTVAGITHYFCSPECRKKYQAGHHG